WEPGFAAESFARAKILRRIGPDAPALKKWLTHPVALDSAPGPVRHRVQSYLDVVAKLGIETARPEFFAAAETGASPVAGSILLSPDSDYGSNHEWPLDRW